MTVNFNLTSPISDTAFLRTNGIPASKNAPPDKKSVQRSQNNATMSLTGDLVTAALNQPEIRAEKVSAMREAIASGTYKVEPLAIATAMLADLP